MINTYLVYELDDSSTHPHQFAIKGCIFGAFIIVIKYHLMELVYGVA